MFQIWIQILALKKKSAMILMYLVSFNIQMGCPLLEKLICSWRQLVCVLY